MVDKILAYEQLAPEADANGWNSQVLFVADNQPDPDSAGAFWDYSDVMERAYLPDTYTAQRVYYDAQPGESISAEPPFDMEHPDPPRPQPPYYPNLGEAREAIWEAMGQGRLLVNYIGHSAIPYWSHQLLSVDHIGVLSTTETLPVMLPMTCQAGYFVQPQPWLTSLGESLVRARGRGAVASWSPTGWGTCEGHHYLDTGFFTAVFEEDVRAVGAAATWAKLYLHENTDGFRDLLETYLLFGDPAMELNVLPADVGITKTVNPQGSVQPGDTLTYTLTYSNAGPATAHNVVVSDVLPIGLVSPTVVSSGAAIAPRPDSRFVWDVADLAAGERGTITMRAVVDAAAQGSISNSATIASSAREADPQDNVTEAVVTLVMRPDGGRIYLPLVLRAFPGPQLGVAAPTSSPSIPRCAQTDDRRGCSPPPC